MTQPIASTSTEKTAIRITVFRLLAARKSYVVMLAPFDYRRARLRERSELYLYVLPLFVADLEELVLLEAEPFRDQVVGEHLDLGVEVADVGVVEAARGLDLVFRVLEVVLELEEVLRGLQVGVVLGDGEQRLERLGEHVLRLGLLVRGLRAHGGGAGLDDLLHGLGLVLGVTLHRLDQVGDEVVTALQLDVDVRPGFIGAVAQGDQAVVDGDQPGDDHHEEQAKDDHDDIKRTHRTFANQEINLYTIIGKLYEKKCR